MRIECAKHDTSGYVGGLTSALSLLLLLGCGKTWAEDASYQLRSTGNWSPAERNAQYIPYSRSHRTNAHRPDVYRRDPNLDYQIAVPVNTNPSVNTNPWRPQQRRQWSGDRYQPRTNPWRHQGTGEVDRQQYPLREEINSMPQRISYRQREPAPSYNSSGYRPAYSGYGGYGSPLVHPGIGGYPGWGGYPGTGSWGMPGSLSGAGSFGGWGMPGMGTGMPWGFW